MTIMLMTKSMVTFMMVNEMTMVIDHGFQSDYQLDDEHDDDFMLKIMMMTSPADEIKGERRQRDEDHRGSDRRQDGRKSRFESFARID